MVKITIYSNRPAGKRWTNLYALAVRVKEKYPDKVEVETIYSGFLSFGHKDDAIKPPNIAVDDKIFGAEPTFEEVVKAVMEKLSWRKQFM